MREPMNHRPELQINVPGLPGTPDPAGRLEPLGVPLSRLGAILRRHLLLLLLVFVLGSGGTAYIMKSLPKQYTAEASLLIEPRRTQVSDLQAITPDPGDIASLIRTQIDILGSSTLMMGVVQNLHLEDDPEFAPGDGGLKTLLLGIVDRAIGEPEKAQPAPTAKERIELAAAALSNKISFANELHSSVLKVMVTTHRAELSAQIANEIARQYLEFKRQEKFAAMQRAHDWFQEQLAGLAEQARTDEAAVEIYRAQHGLVDLPDDGTSGAQRATSIARQQLGEVASQLMQVTRERAQKEATLTQAKAAMSGAQTGTLPAVLSSPVINQLIGQEATVAGREAELAASEGNNNPDLIAVRAQLAKLQHKIQQEMGYIVQSLSTEVQSARQQEEMLQKKLDNLRGSVGQENTAEVGLQSLRAKARATRSIYDSFLTRATQLANVGGIQEPDASLVSGAIAPLGPSAPRPLRFVAVAALLSVVIGAGLACFIERIRGGYGSPEQLEAGLGLRALTVVPKVSGRARRLGTGSRNAARFSASLDRLRGYLLALGDKRPKSLMITSALPREGKSFLAAGLANNLAAAGWRVLLIECDFRRPSVKAYFKQLPGTGLAEVLTGHTLGTTDTVYRQVRPGLYVIPAGRSTGDPQELLASQQMRQFLTAMQEKFDIVLLDTPPVLPVSDGLVLAGCVDATLIAVRWEKTPRSVVEDAVRLLHNSHARLIGSVMTYVDLRRAAQATGRPTKLYEYASSYRNIVPR